MFDNNKTPYGKVRGFKLFVFYSEYVTYFSYRRRNTPVRFISRPHHVRILSSQFHVFPHYLIEQRFNATVVFYFLSYFQRSIVIHIPVQRSLIIHRIKFPRIRILVPVMVQRIVFIERLLSKYRFCQSFFIFVSILCQIVSSLYYFHFKFVVISFLYFLSPLVYVIHVFVLFPHFHYVRTYVVFSNFSMGSMSYFMSDRRYYRFLAFATLGFFSRFLIIRQPIVILIVVSLRSVPKFFSWKFNSSFRGVVPEYLLNRIS